MDLLDAACKTELKQTSHTPERLHAAVLGWDAYFASGHALAPVPDDAKLHLCGAKSLANGTKVGKKTPVHRFCAEADALLDARTARDASLSLARLRLVKRLLDEGPAALRARKREKRVLAYDDILANLHRALHAHDGAALALRLRARFPAALVDEFQDTDPVQFGIFRAIYEGSPAPVFFVGDPKQAIYSFRNADLHTYMRAAALATRRDTLDSNQRSTPDLVAGVNAVFGANAGAFMLPGLAYHRVGVGEKRRKALVDHSSPRSDFTVWLLPRGADGELLERSRAQQLAANATAGEISRLLREARAGRIRLDADALEPREVAVLVRSHRQGAMVREALRALGVGSVELAEESVFATTDAEDVERVLAAVLEPGHAGYLKGALATELARPRRRRDRRHRRGRAAAHGPDAALRGLPRHVAAARLRRDVPAPPFRRGRERAHARALGRRAPPHQPAAPRRAPARGRERARGPRRAAALAARAAHVRRPRTTSPSFASNPTAISCTS